ncbi:hypothetical protein LTR86_008201 [Recurvomyces mirabilis]|nr:hypothetical protein LTR86_008201 [Recurvomyces mirabilis]
MTTAFSSLPIVDLSVLSEAHPSSISLQLLSQRLYDVFATTGFAYLVGTPLSSTHEDVFGLAKGFFKLDEAQKLRLAKKTFVSQNSNTYRGYFPIQPGHQDNLKEGFEIGPSTSSRDTHTGRHQKFNLTEDNVWPPSSAFSESRQRLENFHTELQTLSATLLSLLAVALGKPPDHFASYLVDSLSTLRLLHYPPQQSSTGLCCTPHTDSGLLTLLHQDPTGGLEVQNADGEWIPAPYVPGSLVVNIGDLMAKVSGGRFVATMHRVRSSASAGGGSGGGIGRLSVPFFFEPGENCVVRSVDGGQSVIYGEYVRKKMGDWVEYQDMPEDTVSYETATSAVIEAY